MKRVWLALVLLVATNAAAREQTLVPMAATPRLACGVGSSTWTSVDGDATGFEERTAGPDGGAGCLRTELLRWTFTTRSETPRELVTLRARYQHGFVAYLDGVEVARRRMPLPSTLDSLATDVHGPEWERIPLTGIALAPGAHVLAVEAHAHTLGREARFDAELVASDAPRIARGPYLLAVTMHDAQIGFETDAPTRAVVRFGAALPDHDVRDDALATRHVVTIGPLRPATTYVYEVHVRAGDTEWSSERIQMHTPPERGRSLRFVAYGDVRSGHDIHAEVSRSIAADDPDLAISTGDLVDMGSDEADWDKYFEVATPLLRSVPVYVAAGNHDLARAGKGVARFRTLFEVHGPTWRAWTVAGVRFIALDSSQFRNPEQLAWLRKELANDKGARATFVFMHEGPFSSGMHGDNETAKAQYVPVLEAAGVTLVVSGHDHDYERGRVGRLEYLVTGGGGAELRTQRCGVPGKKPCLPRVELFVNEHNYVLFDVLPKLLRVCPKRPDGSPLEACFTRSLTR